MALPQPGTTWLGLFLKLHENSQIAELIIHLSALVPGETTVPSSWLGTPQAHGAHSSFYLCSIQNQTKKIMLESSLANNTSQVGVELLILRPKLVVKDGECFAVAYTVQPLLLWLIRGTAAAGCEDIKLSHV